MPEHDPDAGYAPRERTRRALHRAIDRILHGWPHAIVDAQARGYTTAPAAGAATGDPADPTGNAALRADHADRWLARLEQLCQTLTGIYHEHYDGWTPRLRQDDDKRQPPAWDQKTFLEVMLLSNHLHPGVERLCLQPVWDEHTCIEIMSLGNQAACWWPPPPTKGATVAGVTIGERGNPISLCALCGQPVIGGANDPIRRIGDDIFHKSPCWYAAAMSRGTHPRAG